MNLKRLKWVYFLAVNRSMMAAFAGGVVDQINNNANGNIRQLFCEIEVNSAWQNFHRQAKHGREQFLKWNYSPTF